MIGVDGHGWIGHDANGNRIYKSDAELEAERESDRRQREIDDTRAETLYVSDRHQVFFLTHQPGEAYGSRHAYITARPFNTLTAAARRELNEKAEPWHENGSAVRISRDGPNLVFRDDITGTETAFDLALMDLTTYRGRFNQVARDDVWAQYTAEPAPPGPLTISFKL